MRTFNNPEHCHCNPDGSCRACKCCKYKSCNYQIFIPWINSYIIKHDLARMTQTQRSACFQAHADRWDQVKK